MTEPTSRFFRLRKLPPRSMAFVVPLLLSVKMTFIVSGISTVKSLGFGAGFFDNWMASWALSWVVAFPVLLVMLPVVRRLAELIVERPGPPPRRG
jgi:hypothetical protein